LSLVGIIANPAASKDIRRLVAQGRVIPDWEKVNTVRRVMLGLQSVGVTNVLAMADSSNLVRRACDVPNLSIDLEFVDMPSFYSEGDTVRAAAAMAEQGVDCLIPWAATAPTVRRWSAAGLSPWSLFLRAPITFSPRWSKAPWRAWRRGWWPTAGWTWPRFRSPARS